MSKQELVQKAREYNHHAIANAKAGLPWVADLAADMRNAYMAEARRR